MVFSDYHASVQVTLLGQGAALTWKHLVLNYVKENRLHLVADTRIATGQSFFLVSPSGRKPSAQHLLFRDWVIGKAQQEREDAALRP